MIKLTEQAVKALQEMAQSESLKPTIRISAKGFGCAGMGWDIIFEELDATELDETFEQEGITVIIDCISNSYIDGKEIMLNYIETDFEKGFRFSGNGDEGYRSCGCSSSWSP